MLHPADGWGNYVPIGKAVIQIFSLHIRINSRSDWLFNLDVAIGLREGKLWIPTGCRPRVERNRFRHVIRAQDRQYEQYPYDQTRLWVMSVSVLCSGSQWNKIIDLWKQRIKNGWTIDIFFTEVILRGFIANSLKKTLHLRRSGILALWSKSNKIGWYRWIQFGHPGLVVMMFQLRNHVWSQGHHLMNGLFVTVQLVSLY